MTFFDRFAEPVPGPPLSLQLLFPDRLDLDAEALTQFLQTYHPELAGASVELVDAIGNATAARLVTADGPPASVLGLLSWGPHLVKLAGFDAPMPYGPVESCVRPAMIPPEMKDEANRHASHVLLYYAGTARDPLEGYVALAAAAGALARFGAIVVMNEEARTAAPAFDLVPDPEEDALATLRGLPIPYLWGGFVKLDVGDATRPWVRTFANHRLGLPDLAYHLTGHAETSRVFKLFAGMLGYLRQTGETFEPGDMLDLGDAKLRLRAPTEPEWYLESDGAMLVVEPLTGE